MKNLLLSFLLVLVSCGPGKTPLIFNKTLKTNLGAQADLSTYQKVKIQIIDTQCIRCHSKLTSEESLQQWIKPGSPEESKLFTVIETGSMPKNAPALGTKDLELIRTYISELAVPDFERVKAEILVKGSCLNCHRSMDSEANLAKWIDRSAPANSKFYLRVKDGTMPKGGPALTEAQVALVLKYVTAFSESL